MSAIDRRLDAHRDRPPDDPSSAPARSRDVGALRPGARLRSGRWWCPTRSTRRRVEALGAARRGRWCSATCARSRTFRTWRRCSRWPGASSPISSSASAAAARWIWPSSPRSCREAGSPSRHGRDRRRSPAAASRWCRSRPRPAPAARPARGALVTDPATQNKLAVQSRYMLADFAVVDPDLTLTVPASSHRGDRRRCLAHCAEAYTSRKAHPLIDLYALEGIRLVGRYLPRAVRDGGDREARAGLALASLYGGFCLGPVNTTAGHAVAYPLGTRHHIAARPRLRTDLSRTRSPSTRRPRWRRRSWCCRRSAAGARRSRLAFDATGVLRRARHRHAAVGARRA